MLVEGKDMLIPPTPQCVHVNDVYINCLQELEDLLDDDEDMLAMYLARKEMQKEAAREESEHGGRDGEADESAGESTEEEEMGGDLFPISPVHRGKIHTPFSQIGDPPPLSTPHPHQ